MDTKYTKRILAHIILEAETPLIIGSGEKDFITDSTVQIDVNGLPYIPGTTLAGLIRHSIDKEYDSCFGIQDADNSFGSEIIVSEAKLVNENNIAVEAYDNANSDFLSMFKTLPIRQHVRIGHMGTSENGGKFDEQIIYKGSRFCFEIELLQDKDTNVANCKILHEIIKALSSQVFRIGRKTRSGFGEIKLVSVKTLECDLTSMDGLETYLNTSSALNKDYSHWAEYGNLSTDDAASDQWTRYEISLKPCDFFIFGSGNSSTDADIIPLEERYVAWNDNTASFVEGKAVIPASSVKGAIAHRVAYHYNLDNRIFADRLSEEELKNYSGQSNPAVKAIFGSAKKGDNAAGRGNVIFSDIFLTHNNTKILNHVKIDRFTGGAMNGALFTEKVTEENADISFVILYNENKTAQFSKYLEAALKDLCKGRLPLGGGNARGHGFFHGDIIKNGRILDENNK